MTIQAETNEFVELTSEQRSGEVQYAHFSVETRVEHQKKAGVLLKRFSTGGLEHSRKRVKAVLGYRRSLDFDEGNHPGQDFAGVRGGDDGYIVGVVADGVSQSFYGEIAAYCVGKWLLHTFWQERESPPSEDRLEEKLKELETELAPEVVSYPVPQHLAPTLREVLENRRSKGSQAVFAAFVWNAKQNTLGLYQVGDVDALIHYPDGSLELDRAAPTGRWSSAGESEMHLKERSYEGISGIVIKSDGAGKEWGESLADNALNQSAFTRLAQTRAGDDDVSFIAAYWNELQEPQVSNQIRTRAVVSEPELRHQLGRREALARARRRRRHNRRRKAVLFVLGLIICVLLVANLLVAMHSSIECTVRGSSQLC
ncbi:MAG: protein phosphatase 2C domain-containing protein [Rubrobacter sp.]|nr:protein phosphatase 2C domain-containing protein [Rubrobacter sp.]